MKARGGKLKVEEEIEEKAKNWNWWQWMLAWFALGGLTYGGIRFIEWAMK